VSIADDYADIARHLRALSPSGMLFADDPVVLSDFPEGEKCPGCGEGIFRLTEPENCSCHLHPPCGACMATHLQCSVCSATPEGVAP
jgi:hypothetical protein